MSTVDCPACGHTFEPGTEFSTSSPTPDPSVLGWFRNGPGWLGELSADEVYEMYLRATTDRPVSRKRFIADLLYLGVEEFHDGDIHMLTRV